MSSLKQVAERAKVSPITVSRVVNSPELVSPKTIEKVQRAMKELNYSINPAAQALAAKRTNVIDVYVPKHIGLEDFYVMQLISGISDVCSRNMYSFLIIRDINSDNACDGYIVTGVYDEELDEIASYAKSKKRGLTLFGRTERNDIDYIAVDNFSGAKNMVSYLIDQGHQKIGVLNISEKKISEHSRERFEGYCSALAEHGLEVAEDYIFRAENNVAAAYNESKKFLKNTDATAFFCTSDVLAIGMMNACSDLGISIPDDLSIDGFDGFGYQNMTLPHITTIKQPIFKIGQMLAESLLGQLKNKNHQAVKEVVEPLFLQGGTVRNRKGV